MKTTLFVSQRSLVRLEEAGMIRFKGNRLTILPEEQSFCLVPAVRFLRLLGGDASQGSLVGKVHTVEEVRSMGGEHYLDSVVLGETAYQVQEGFIGTSEPAGAEESAAVAAEGPTAGSSPAPGSEEAGDTAPSSPSDEDLLARFLLGNGG